MADYENKVHNIYFTTNFLPTEKLRIFATLAYNKAEGSLEEVIMPDIEAQLNGDLEDQDFTFEEMHTYSDLDYKYLNLNIGLSYALTPTVSWTADGDFIDLTDNTGYVYGNESGSYFLIRTGFKIDF